MFESPKLPGLSSGSFFYHIYATGIPKKKPFVILEESYERMGLQAKEAFSFFACMGISPFIFGRILGELIYRQKGASPILPGRLFKQKILSDGQKKRQDNP